jgi:hypothetical protein
MALALAATGLPVFPCNADKRPAIPKAKGGNGFHDASTDPDRIRELWDLARCMISRSVLPVGIDHPLCDPGDGTIPGNGRAPPQRGFDLPVEIGWQLDARRGRVDLRLDLV